jgi:hypothetical protein
MMFHTKYESSSPRGLFQVKKFIVKNGSLQDDF